MEGALKMTTSQSVEWSSDLCGVIFEGAVDINQPWPQKIDCSIFIVRVLVSARKPSWEHSPHPVPRISHHSSINHNDNRPAMPWLAQVVEDCSYHQCDLHLLGTSRALPLSQDAAKWAGSSQAATQRSSEDCSLSCTGFGNAGPQTVWLT